MWGMISEVGNWSLWEKLRREIKCKKVIRIRACKNRIKNIPNEYLLILNEEFNNLSTLTFNNTKN